MVSPVRRTVIIGSNGQLAKAIKIMLPSATFLGRQDCDLSDVGRLDEILEPLEPELIINAAAYTQVDKAEQEEALATVINADAPAAMAIFCRDRNIPFIHFSTDYVFDGKSDKPYDERSIPAPLNAYGRSKLAGENAIVHIGGRYLIFRTSWVYAAWGKNFFNTILRLSRERSELSIINDQYGAPTYAPHLAAGTLQAIESALEQQVFPSGIYHMCNGGYTSWFGFASAIIDLASRYGMPVLTKVMHSIPAVEYPLPAIRPYNSRLDCTTTHSIFGAALPHWEVGLKECMEAWCENK